MAAPNIEYIWKDRKRYFGMPISFTRYALSEDRLFTSVGFLNLKDDEVLLYRVRDIDTSRTLGQRLFGVGTVTVLSSDKTMPNLVLKNIKDPVGVKELLHKLRSLIKEHDKQVVPFYPLFSPLPDVSGLIKISVVIHP